MHFSNTQQLKQTFEEVYTDIFKTRFWGLPIANHHLTVQVIGLRETDDFYTFSLVTPWMLNQVAVPKHEEVDARPIEGMRLDKLDRLGSFYVTNAISPMDIFGNMDMAIEEGEKLAEQLFARISNENDEQPEDKSRREFFQKIIRKN
ncbi:MAG: [NiFe]-hydrogenase assembly chaperone HybE [bacterium]